MIDSFGWNLTVVGALLCLAYGWFLIALGRSQRVRFGKTGLIVGVIGALVLAGMAVVKPLHDVSKPKAKRVISMTVASKGYPTASQGVVRFEKLLSVATRTTQKVGRRPSKNHVAYESPSGKLEWVTREEYRELLRKKREQRD